MVDNMIETSEVLIALFSFFLGWISRGFKDNYPIIQEMYRRQKIEESRRRNKK